MPGLRVPHSSSGHVFTHSHSESGTLSSMSGPDGNAASIIAEYYSLATQNYVQYATITLLLYEYAITLPAEVNLFWRRRWTGASVLFLMNRYVSILFYIPAQTNQFGTSSAATCRILTKATEVMNVILLTTLAIFPALRAYALTRSHAVYSVIFCLSMVRTGINATQLGNTAGIVVPGIGCVPTNSVSVRTNIAFTIASRLSLIIADTLLVVITWCTLYRRRVLFTERQSLTYIFVRDGTTYFVCLVLFYTSHLVLTLLQSIGNVTIAEPVSAIAVFTEPLTSIFISRFMINLQAVNSRNMHFGLRLGHTNTQSQSLEQNSSLVFDRIIGSLGSSGCDRRWSMDEDQSDWRTESPEGSESTRVEGDHVRLDEI